MGYIRDIIYLIELKYKNNLSFVVGVKFIFVRVNYFFFWELVFLVWGSFYLFRGVIFLRNFGLKREIYLG